MCKFSCIRSYAIGFILSIILILLSALIVDKHWLGASASYVTVAILLIVQIIVQIAFFLRVNGKVDDDRWNIISLVFTLLIILILVSGTLWIMDNLNYNMHMMH